MVVLTVLLSLISASAVDETVPEVPAEEVVYEFDAGDDESAGVALAAIQDAYGVGTSHISIFAGIVGKLPMEHHYVYFREGQYDYVLVHSADMEYDGASFRAADVETVTYSTSGGYQEQPTITFGSETEWSLSPGDYLVWSDLGDYPDLINRGEVRYAALSCIILVSFAVWFMLDRLVFACKRSR